MANTLVYVTTIPRPTATTVSNFKAGTSGMPMNKTKVGRATDRLAAL